MSLLALDTNVLLYALMRDTEFHELAADLLRGKLAFELLASELIITELLSHHSVKTKSEYAKVDGLIHSGIMRLMPVSSEALYIAARLRREQGFALADALHIAGALVAGATHFVTHDRGILKKPVDDITFVNLPDAAALATDF